MPTSWLVQARKAVVAALIGTTTLSCQAPGAGPVPAAVGVPGTTAFALDPVALTDALAAKPSRNWQDAMLTYPALRERRREAETRSLQAVTAPGWSYQLTGGLTSTNVPAYTKENVYARGPLPAAGDRLYVLTNNARVLRFDPTSATAPAHAAPAMSPVGALPGTYNKTAVAVSGDNNRVYAFSTAGHFTILDAETLTQTYSKDISASGFDGTACFIDYGLSPSGGGTVFGSIEHVYAVSRNGSVFRIVVDGNTSPPTVKVNAATAPGETNPGGGAWTTSTALAIPASTVVGFPIAWKGHVYYGTNAGQFYHVSFAAPTAPVLAGSWDLARNTTATGLGRAITAPAAMDLDWPALNATSLFVSCGDRVNWIDLTDGTVTASPSLTLDRSKAVAPAGAPPNQGLLSGFSPISTTLRTYNPDWVSIKRGQLPPPTRWGGPLATLSSIPALSVRTRPNGDVWVCDYGKTSAPVRQPNVTIYHADGRPAKVINLSGPPTKLEFDGQGFAWLSVSGYSTFGSQGRVEKINCATETLVGGAFPVTFRGAVYIAPDANGNCWVTDPFNRPGNGSPDATSGSGTAGRLQCIKANGTFAFAKPIAVPVAGTIFCDPNNRPWVMPYGANVIYRYTAAPAGSLQPPPAAPNVLTVGGGGSIPIGIAFRPATTEAWVTLNGQSKIAKINYNSFTQIGGLLPASGTGPTNPWTIRFDANGEPWVGCGRLNQTTPSNVVKLDLNGNIVPGYNYPMGGYGGSPYELAMDAGDAVYVACANPTFSAGALAIITQDLGNTGDIFGSAFRGAAGDGDDSYGFMRFKWPVNAFGNQPVVDAKLSLTQNAANSGDNLAFFTADNTRPNGTLWTGYLGGATPNADWDSRPALRVPFFTLANGAPGTGMVRTVDVPAPADKANVAGDAANAHYTLAVQSTNKPLRSAVHWFSDNTNTTVAQLPTLNMRTNSYAQLSTAAGIACQPSIDSYIGKVWVAASNALFELDYSSKGNFMRADRTYYNFTTNGRSTGYGPVNTGTSPRTYLNATGNALLTANGHLAIADVTPSGALSLNHFNLNLAPTANRLVSSVDPSPAAGGVNAQMLYDYDNGSVYAVTTNNYVIRAKVF
jgi:hypothetical protein